MKFIDRIKEQEVLQTALVLNESNFIVIYGRRYDYIVSSHS